MGFFDRIANFIFEIAVGNEKKRWLLTPIWGAVFFCFVCLFFIFALWLDSWLRLPSIIYLPWTLIIAILLIIPGALLGGWTFFTFIKAHGTPVPINPPQNLIITGLYRYSRNPMMLGLYLALFGIGLIIGSFSLTFIFTPLFIVVMSIYVKRIEEKELELKFGNDYLEYKKKVGMYFPKLH